MVIIYTGDDDVALLLYNERLSIQTDDAASRVGRLGVTASLVGQYSITASRVRRFSVIAPWAKHCSDDCLLVQAVSQGQIGAATCGTTVTAYIDAAKGRRLETLQHQQHEYIIVRTNWILYYNIVGHSRSNLDDES